MSKVVYDEHGDASVVEVEKARVSSDLSAGRDRAVNAGVAEHDRATVLPTTQSLGRSAAIAAVAYATGQEPAPGSSSDPLGRPPSRPSRNAALDAVPPGPPPLRQPPQILVGNLGDGGSPAPPGFSDVRIDRRTKFGNPFPMGQDGHDESYRDAVCDACDELVDDPLGADQHRIAERRGLHVDPRFGDARALRTLDEALRELEERAQAGEKLRLLCWCAPKRCHGHGIARRIIRNVEGARPAPTLHPPSSPARVAPPGAPGSRKRPLAAATEQPARRAVAAADDPPDDLAHFLAEWRDDAAVVAATPRVGFYALDLSSAYRYACMQLLDLWCHTFLWLDADGRAGFFIDRRLCFGGAYWPNRFERLTTLLGAVIERRIAAFDA